MPLEPVNIHGPHPSGNTRQDLRDTLSPAGAHAGSARRDLRLACGTVGRAQPPGLAAPVPRRPAAAIRSSGRWIHENENAHTIATVQATQQVRVRVAGRLPPCRHKVIEQLMWYGLAARSLQEVTFSAYRRQRRHRRRDAYYLVSPDARPGAGGAGERGEADVVGSSWPALPAAAASVKRSSLLVTDAVVPVRGVRRSRGCWHGHMADRTGYSCDRQKEFGQVSGYSGGRGRSGL